MSLAHSKESII